MTMFDNNNDHIKFLKIDNQKFIEFQEWCAKNDINYLVVIEQFIDSCLENNPLIIETIIHQKDSNNFENKINLIVSKYIQPLLHRIENLESEWQEKKSDLQNKKKSNSQPLLSDLSQEELTKRIYLPRQEVWQRLKKTDYIQYCGYDSFLKVKGDELKEYGIFFDENKKRFYVIDND